MNILDSWVEVQNLFPGKPYRASYKTICLNSVPNDSFAKALEAKGILTNNPGVSGPVTAVMSGYSMDFAVSRTMTSSEFRAALIAAFAEASSQSWIECSAPELQSVSTLVAGSSPLAGFQGGAVFALLIVGALVAVVVWKSK